METLEEFCSELDGASEDGRIVYYQGQCISQTLDSVLGTSFFIFREPLANKKSACIWNDL